MTRGITSDSALFFCTVCAGGYMKQVTFIFFCIMCSGGLWALAAADEGGTEIRLGAAISLSPLVTECIARYEEQFPDVKITAIYGSSGSIRRQIENGAPLDIFLSASADHMDVLEKNGLILNESRNDIVTNRLVLIVPRDNATALSFADLVHSSVTRVALGEPSSVPAGKYAVQTLERVGVLEPVLQKVVYAKNVRQVLYYVEAGEADAGIVYLSEAFACEKVRITAYAEEGMHERVVYPGAIVRGCSNCDAALAFITWLTQNEAQALFEQYGFGVP